MMNPVEIGLAFLEGLALIISPCILPVLPLVLATSVEGGRKRPFGIITGFVLSFTAFAFLSRQLVNAFEIDLAIIQNVSLVVLALFGVVMLSGKLSDLFSRYMQSFADWGGKLTANAGEGFTSGIVIGMAIGLIWTPCAGPVLAAALVQIIRQQSDLQALFLVAAFALGAGVPMLLIALTGRKIMSKIGFVTKHTEGIRKAFGVVILAAVAFIASGAAAQLALGGDRMEMSREAGLQDGLQHPYQAPEISGIDTWLNSQPLKLADLKGKVVLIDFWTYSCINCVRTLPYVTKWDEMYRDKGLVVIGVHSPEFAFEKDKGNVAAAIAKYGIKYPVALDNKFDTWTAFKNHYWPAHYLIDKQGNVVYTHFGEGNYGRTENNIRYLLGLNEKAVKPVEKATVRGQTPETYLGYGRAQHFASPENVAQAQVQAYSFPQFLKTDQWALSGKWRIDGRRIVAAEKGATLRLNFTAGRVFLVMGHEDDKAATATIKLNGETPADKVGKDAAGGRVTVANHELYELINQGKVANGYIEITADAPGLEAYAFTFGK